MRLLHTSDWHLGQSLHEFERSAEHQAFLDWLCASLRQYQIDALLIAGDVFDNANPSAASQRQFYQFLRQARSIAPALQTIIIAGNHDSAGRLEAPGPLLDALGVRIIGQPGRDARGEPDLNSLCAPLLRADGGIGAQVLAVPFLRPGDLARGEHLPYAQAVAQLYQALQAHARAQLPPGAALLAMGHCHMQGGQVSEDSERPLVIGGSEALSAAMFEADVAYVALGHLHRAQQVGGQNHIRYSGSPLPLSFAETDYKHQVLLVELDGARLRSVESLYVPRSVPVLRVPARPAPLDEVLQALRALEAPPVPFEQQALVRPYILIEGPQADIRIRLEQALEGKAVRMAGYETAYARQEADAAAPVQTHHSMDEVQRLQPAAIFAHLHQEKYGSAPPPDIQQLFAELMLMEDA
ncbi:exonuclease subunit SbcD [Massilia sp. W12]|uniref:exonuclease SbcCD subunit D n=1 Tax=Massilia sp. W12 TaxID=3126507 RepID=UPI0030D0C625